MHFKRKRAEPIFGSQLRFAEKPAGIYVTRKSTGRNSSKIIDTSRPSARMESRPAAAGHNAQLDFPE
jgi:hypothetical protein